mmetsp:Transcript_72803/g.204467  ORF Transcript_72803/g.204467 Transcript_72803/m.204467 type:complete len:276 (-) Transcript_72803:76-903(-)
MPPRSSLSYYAHRSNPPPTSDTGHGQSNATSSPSVAMADKSERYALCMPGVAPLARIITSISQLRLVPLLPVRDNRLHRAQAARLDGAFLLVQSLLLLLILRLKSLHQVLQLLLRRGDLAVLLLDRSLQLVHGHRHQCVQLILALLIAEVQVRRTTTRAHVLLHELVQVAELPITLVLLQVGRIAIPQCGEALHAGLLAEVLAFGCAIDVSDDNALVTVVLLHELVPSRLQCLAMAAPRREILDEHHLARRLLVPILGRQVHSPGLPDHRRQNHG